MKCAPVVMLALAGAVSVSCSEPSSRDQRIARNCQSADEGEKLFQTYRHRLVVAKDWELVGWTRQVPIAKWMACRHKLTSHAAIDDCLDKLSYDETRGQIKFDLALQECVALATKKQAGS